MVVALVKNGAIICVTCVNNKTTFEHGSISQEPTFYFQNLLTALFVALSGKMLNIKDAYSHPMFYKGLDEKTGFRTR